MRPSFLIVLPPICLAASGAQAQSPPALFHVTHDTYACQNPRATLALTNPAEPRRADPNWVSYVINDGHCAPVTPRSPWTLVNRQGELAYMTYAGTTGLPGSFFFKSADLAELPAPPATQASPPIPSQATVPSSTTPVTSSPLPPPAMASRPPATPAGPDMSALAQALGAHAPDAAPGKVPRAASGYIDPPEARQPRPVPAPQPSAPPPSAVPPPAPAAMLPAIAIQAAPAAPDHGSHGGAVVFALVGLGLLGLLLRQRKKPDPTRSQPRTAASSSHAPLEKREVRPAPNAKTRPTRSEVGPFPTGPAQPASGRGAVAVWHAQDIAASIRGHLIRKGMVYVGAVHPSAPCGSPCFIDPVLGVATASPETSGFGMPYWPTYDALTPQCRLAYLQWLAGDRSDPSAYIGYVFLYFYGLEHRLLVDGATAAEGAAIAREVERLRGIYGISRSFAGYSQRLLEALEIKRILANPELLDGYLPSLQECPYQLPLLAKLAIASRVARGEPIAFELAAAWTLGLAEGSLPIDRRVFQHAREQFLQSLKARFDEACPLGLRLKASREESVQLDLRYKGATMGLQVDLAPPGQALALPDPAGLNWGAMASLAVSAAKELEAYAKRAATRPAWRSSVEALSLLPPAIRRDHGAQAAAWLASLAMPLSVVPYGEVAERVLGEPGTRCTPRRHEKVEAALAALGFGIEPRAPAAAGTEVASMVLFPDASAGTPRSQRYCVAELGAELLSVTARLNPASAGSVELAWCKDIAARLGLQPAEALRLTARLRWLADTRTSVGRIRKALAETGRSDQVLAASSVAAAVAGNGHVMAEQVAVLEQVYDGLQLSRQDLYATIHGASFQAGAEAVVDASPDATAKPVEVVAYHLPEMAQAPRASLAHPSPSVATEVVATPMETTSSERGAPGPMRRQTVTEEELPLVASGMGEMLHGIPARPPESAPTGPTALPSPVPASRSKEIAAPPPPRTMALDERRLAQLREETEQVDAVLSGVYQVEEVPANVPQQASGPSTPPQVPAVQPLANRLDEGRLARIRAETEKVSSVLAGVFQEEEPVVLAPAPPTVVNADAHLPGLPSALAGLVRTLRQRAEWPRAEFEAIVLSAGLMPDGALEAVNEWAYDQLGGPLIEDGDPLALDLHLLDDNSEIADAA